MKFVELTKSLKEEIAPVYLMEGEEAYFRDHAVEALRNACNLTQPSLNDVRVEGESAKADLAAFVGGLSTIPFFDEKRFVRVYEFYPTEREWEKFLKPYMENPCPSTVLAIVNTGKKAGACEMKRKGGVVYVDCSRESEEMLQRWLYSMMRHRGLNADVDAVSLMVRYCASDAARMKMETDKLVLLLGEGGRVTASVVEEQVAKDTEYKIYELTQAASRQNFPLFTEILGDLLQKGYDENAALSFLTSHFKTLLELSETKASENEAAKMLGLKPYAVKRNRETAARLGKERVRELYLGLYALSCGSKSGEYGKTGALTAAIAKIFFNASKSL